MRGNHTPFAVQSDVLIQVQAWIGFFETKGIADLKEDDLLGPWFYCIWLHQQRGLWLGGAEDLFGEVMCKLAALDPARWPALGTRRTWLNTVMRNLFWDQLKMAKRRRIRERCYAERQV